MRRHVPSMPAIGKSALLTAVSTIVISGASGAAAIVIAHRFGRTQETDGFFVAYAIYLVMTLGASTFRVVVVPSLTRAQEQGRLRAELLGFAWALAIPSAGLLVVAIAAGIAVSGSATTDAFAHALPWMVAAGILQLYAGLAASALAADESYAVVAAGYAIGSVASLGVFVAFLDHGLSALLWGQVANGVASLGIPLVALARRRIGEGSAAVDVLPRLFTLARGAAVPVALQALYAIAAAFASHLGTGEATTFNYAFFFASFLIAATATPLALVSSAPLTRRGLTPDSAAEHIVATSWLSLSVIVAAVGTFSLVGARVVSAVLGGAYDGQAGHDLGRLVIAFAPWMVVAVALNVSFPLLFVAERPRLLIEVAVVVPLLQVGAAWILMRTLHLTGLALSLALLTFLTLGIMIGSLSRRSLLLVAVGLTRVTLLVMALGLLSFGLTSLVVGGFPAAIVGAALYVGLLALAWPLGPRSAWRYFQELR